MISYILQVKQGDNLTVGYGVQTNGEWNEGDNPRQIARVLERRFSGWVSADVHYYSETPLGTICPDIV